MVHLLPEAAIFTNRSHFFSLDNPEMPLENDAYPLDGAGVLDTALDFCRRKDWIEVCAPKSFAEGSRLEVYSNDGNVHRGAVTVMAVSIKLKRIYLDQLPSDMQPTDLLVVSSVPCA